jgi:hypothetical protein
MIRCSLHRATESWQPKYFSDLMRIHYTLHNATESWQRRHHSVLNLQDDRAVRGCISEGGLTESIEISGLDVELVAV